MKKQAPNEFFKLFVTETETEATLLLYGIIGDAEEWDCERQCWVDCGTTDVQFAAEIARLEARYSKINVRINSVGGSMLHGLAIVTSIRNSKAEIHTWNDGMACSMAADIWLAGKVRHMATNALLMIHNPMTGAYGNATVLRNTADTLDKLADASILCMSESTGKPIDEIRSTYYADALDHWLTYTDCEAEGFLSSGVQSYPSNTPPPAGITKTGYDNLLRQYMGAVSAEKRSLVGDIVEGIRKMFVGSSEPSPQPSTTNTPDMNLQEFQKSLANGDLDRAAVLQALGVPEQPAQPTEPEPQPGESPDDFKKALALANEKIESLIEQVKEIGAEPGAGKTLPFAERDPAQGTDADEKAAFEKRLASYGTDSATARFVE